MRSFASIANRNSKVLILGSMPGVRSLEMGEYYAYSQNQFWAILTSLFSGAQLMTYSQKRKMLLENKIALWDVILTCRRKGSLDSNINNAVLNDLYGFLNEHKNICSIFCNGKKAYKLYKAAYPDIYVSVKELPSTSPAYTKPLKWKIGKWRIIKKILCS